MLPYVALVIIPFLFSFIAFEKRKQFLIQSHVGITPYVKKHNLAIPLFFAMLFFLLAFRSESVGNDTSNYHHYFDAYQSLSFRSFLVFEPEVLYAVLNWIVGRFTDNYQIFLSVVAALTLIPIGYLYTEDKEDSYLKIVLFLNMTTFVMLFSGIRQMLAVSVGIVAYMFARKKKLLFFLLAVVVAIGFHHSAIILVLLYPIYHIRLKQIHLLILIPVVLLIWAFNEQIFLFLAVYYMNFTDAVSDIAIMSTGAMTMLLVFAVFAVFSYIIPDETKMDQEAIALRNILVLALILQCFAPVHALAMRMNYYYIIFIPICIAKMIQSAKAQYVSVAKVAGIAISAFFTLYFLWSMWSAYQTGEGMLHTVPYIPFWEGSI